MLEPKTKFTLFSIVSFIIVFLTIVIPVFLEITNDFIVLILSILVIFPLIAGISVHVKSHGGYIAALTGCIGSLVISAIAITIAGFFAIVFIDKISHPHIFGPIIFFIAIIFLIGFTAQLVFWIFHLRFVKRNKAYFISNKA